MADNTNEWIEINQVPGLEQVLEFVSHGNTPTEGVKEEENTKVVENTIHQRKRQRTENENHKPDLIDSRHYNDLIQKVLTNRATLNELYETLHYIPQNEEFIELIDFIHKKIEKKENEFSPERIISILAMFVFCLNFYSFCI